MSDPGPEFDQSFAAARRAMVTSQLRPQGVHDAHILAAMGAVPREQFVGASHQAVAYGDRTLLIGSGAPMMPPAQLGTLLARLAPQAGERALVVGGGGAYAAAILRHIGLVVDTADADMAPGRDAYDLILVEGAIEHLPASLAGRLAPGGRVGAAIVEDGVTRLATGRAASDNARGKSIAFTTFAEAQIPVLPGFAAAPAFVF